METCRFLNADGYVSTGQGVLGNNMLAYCGNNPISRQDPGGEGWIVAMVAAVACAIMLIGSSAKNVTALPYKSADEAATAFVNSTYSASKYIRHEYGTIIYSRTIKGTTTYNYAVPVSEEPHSVGYGSVQFHLGTCDFGCEYKVWPTP